ncbi:MAG TPA: alanine racemase [Actinomycetota bacterium]|nr:alanine racemase [Actinomycetota bacterium]
MTARFRPTVADVDLDAIRHNARLLKPPGVELMAVVKANGYGHGDVAVATAALDGGATWLGVALVEEGIRLRDAGIEAPILVLTEFPPGSEKDALAAGLTATLYTDEGLERVAEAGRALGRPVGVHVKVDTGMHRVGLHPDRAVRFVAAVARAGLDLEGLWTHFAVSEELGSPSVREQLDRFGRVVAALESGGVRPRYRHAANSAAAMALRESHFDLVRVGVALYGLSPGPALDGRLDLRPAMSLRSRVSLAKRVAAGEALSYGLRYRLDRESTIATVPVGYADGYLRALSERGRVLIRGRRYPVAGTITMDQLLVDLGDDPVEAGDEVVLFGEQGPERIRAEEVAGWAGTIGYEIVCAVSARVPREYRRGGDG